MTTNLSLLSDRRRHLLNDVNDYHVQLDIQSHKSLIERLGYLTELEGHGGCVNCLQWNTDGTLLASGSDDYNIKIWNPYEGKCLASMQTGHIGNIFSVKFMPFTGDNLLVSGAEDHEVKLHDLATFTTIHSWSCCKSRVKRLAVSAHSPYLIWSASEDGCIRQLDTREHHRCDDSSSCRSVLVDLHRTCGSAMGYTQCKCLDINPVKWEQMAVGGFDPFIRLYDLRLTSLSYPSPSDLPPHSDPSCIAHFGPGHITTTRLNISHSNIAATYVTFSPCGRELLANLSTEQVYLFNTMSLEPLFQYNIEGMDSPPSVTVLPPSNLPSIVNHLNSEDEIPHEAKTLRDNGNKYYQEKQYTQAIQCYSSALTICPHWHILYSNRATCLMSRNWSGDVYEALRDTELALYVFPAHYKSLKRRIKLLKVLKWNKEALAFLDSFEEEYPDEEEFIKKMREDVSSEQSRNGYHGLNGARRDMSNWEADRQATAHDYHQRYLGHCNTHTDIKEATFLGERGEYIGAGSDDGNIFIWEKKTGNLVRVLYADENIVNCVQWHPKSCLLATSGIENVIRLWEPKCIDETTRVVGNMVQACSKNQARRRFDPFELMLVGLRMIEDPSTHLRDNVVIQRGDYHIRSEQCHQS